MTIVQKMRTEPAVVIAGIFAILTYAGVRLSEEQISAVSSLATLVLPLVAGLIVRSQVTPVAKLPEVPAR